MNFTTIEILALILIVFAVIKIAIIFINPNTWLNFIGKMYSLPGTVSTIGFLLSLLVLYFIINSGISIIEILAVCLFVSLLMAAGLASYAAEFTEVIKKQDIIEIVKKMWLYSTFWILLIIWGVYELLSR